MGFHEQISNSKRNLCDSSNNNQTGNQPEENASTAGMQALTTNRVQNKPIEEVKSEKRIQPVTLKQVEKGTSNSNKAVDKKFEPDATHDSSNQQPQQSKSEFIFVSYLQNIVSGTLDFFKIRLKRKRSEDLIQPSTYPWVNRRGSMLVLLVLKIQVRQPFCATKLHLTPGLINPHSNHLLRSKWENRRSFEIHPLLEHPIHEQSQLEINVI